MPKYNTTCCCENEVDEACIGNCMNEAPKNDGIPICDQHKGVITLAPRSWCDQFYDIIDKCTIEQNYGNDW